MSFGRLKPKHRLNKVSSQVEATWKYEIPGSADKTRLKELWGTQMQHFVALLEAVDNHAQFCRHWQPSSLIPLSKNITYVSSNDVGFCS